LIAAFSLNSLLVVLKGAETKQFINGMELEYYLVEPGELNIYASEVYGSISEKALAVGTNNANNISLNPTMRYAHEYNRLVGLKLFSVSKIKH
jgi:hypothetical protein